MFGAGIFIVIRNLPLRALHQTFTALAEEKEKAQITLQSIGDAVITTDAQMHIEYLNPIAERLTGWTTAQARGRMMNDVFKIYNEKSRLPATNPIQECLEKNQIVEMENHTILVRHTDQEEFHIEDSAAPIRRADGSILGAVMVFHDVTDRKAAQNRLQHIAFHDALTGLPNRALFRKKLSKAMIDARFMKKHAAVLFLDLDRFKTINDSLGHAVGDELLILVAKRLEQCIRDSDVICRMGGDEFTAVLTSIDIPDNAGTVANKIVDSMAKPFSIQGHELRISTSIGITVYPQDGEDLDDLLKNADAAMYHAKGQGRNNYQYFHADMGAKAAHDLQMESALQAALDNNEFFLEYQPKLNLEKNRIVGCEALLRWQSPEFGRVMPNDFIPRLEETGDIVGVGTWVIRTAINQAKTWLDQGHPIAVSVNVSARQFRQAGLVEQVGAILRSSGLPPALLQVEITESLLMEDADKSEAIMRELMKVGVNVSLDDFGTGYSSLSYLRRFPISELKIDRSFVMDIGTNETAAQIIKTVIDLGQALGMKVTAEGVETDEQRNELQSLGCNEIQGYLLSRPLQKDAFEALINKVLPSSVVEAVENGL
jgi:diguanylate cyclase (GGDEF)-like protein/PAS domain S-box-containing protein